MKFYLFSTILSCLLLPLALLHAQSNAQNSAADLQCNLVRDLLVVDYWNKRINERLPATYNNLLLGGYINMPSARMGQEGEIGLGYTYLHPYRLWNLRVQMNDRFEVTGNYRIFTGVKDPVLSEAGFGDFSDKGANFKVALFHAEDSGCELPGIAFGFEDFIGTRAFRASYVVATQVFLDYNAEVTIGYGRHRIKGLFGGISCMPFLRTNWKYLQNLSFLAEYDATPYRNETIERHPKGRKTKSPINFGIKYRLWDQIDFSASYIRGYTWALSVSSYYNFGMTKGFLPKIDDSLPYKAPVNIEPLSSLRPENVMVQDLVYAFGEQGLPIFETWLSYDECGDKILRLKIGNCKYRRECLVRERLNYLIANLVPDDIDKVIVTIETNGLPVQEYHYTMFFMREFRCKAMGPYELQVLSPVCEASFPNKCTDCLLLKKNLDLYNVELAPKTYTYFGSSTGKFKYALGLSVNINGYFWNDIYYAMTLGYIACRNIDDVKDFDKLNPSQLPNVRTDIVRYYQQKGVTLDQAYLQKNWNMGKGFYSRLSLGFFEVEYGGVAGEFLYYPVKSDWAIGIEGALLRKRKLNSLWFTNRIRQLEGFEPTWRKFQLSQYSMSFYYDWKKAGLEFRLQIGKFLAGDRGVRYEVSRYFPSGLRITLWYTRTNGHDKINGETYYDKGIGFSMPLDIFYTRTECDYWGYGMSAWLRDVGVTAATGQLLYYMINDQRQQ